MDSNRLISPGGTSSIGGPSSSDRLGEKHRRGPSNSPSRLDARLDAALEETFPASDPIAITICTLAPLRLDD